MILNISPGIHIQTFTWHLLYAYTVDTNDMIHCKLLAGHLKVKTDWCFDKKLYLEKYIYRTKICVFMPWNIQYCEECNVFSFTDLTVQAAGCLCGSGPHCQVFSRPDSMWTVFLKTPSSNSLWVEQPVGLQSSTAANYWLNTDIKFRRILVFILSTMFFI